MSAAIEKAESKEWAKWEQSAFTDDQLVVLLASMTKTKPAKTTPKNIRDLVLAEAMKQGKTVSDAKAILRIAMTPTGGAVKAAAKPQPARNPPKDSPKQRPNPGQAPKHPAPAKKATGSVASTGTTKPQIILNAIKAPKGASLTALMGLTGWQAHSVRGCIATLKTQQGYGIDSEKVGTDRMYRLTSEPKEAKQAAAARRKPAPRVTAAKKAKKAAPKKRKAS